MAGRRGPAPAPAAVKKAKGNPGKRPITTEEMEAESLAAQSAAASGAGSSSGASPGEAESLGDGGGGQLASAAIVPPEWINPDGLAVWQRIAPRLQAMKILQSIDAEAFGRYCQNFGRWVKLQKKLDAEGETYESASPHGTYQRAHPAFMIADRLDRALQRDEANFALNPADRQRLFAARAAAAGAGGADLFGHPSGGGGKGAQAPADPERPRSPVGYLN